MFVTLFGYWSSWSSTGLGYLQKGISLELEVVSKQ